MCVAPADGPAAGACETWLLLVVVSVSASVSVSVCLSRVFRSGDHQHTSRGLLVRWDASLTLLHACSPPPPPPPPHPPSPVCEAFVDIFNATGNIHNMSAEITTCCSTFVEAHLPAPAAASPPPVAALPTVWSVVLEGDGVGGAALSPPFSVQNTAYMIRLRPGDSDKQLGATLSISTTPAYVAALRCWAASDMDSSKPDWSPRRCPRNGNTASLPSRHTVGWPDPSPGCAS